MQSTPLSCLRTSVPCRENKERLHIWAEREELCVLKVLSAVAEVPLFHSV